MLESSGKNMKMEPVGRGQVFELVGEGGQTTTLIDESYNANPASMCAALENLSLYPANRRKLAVLGDMLELGDEADNLHAALKAPLIDAKIDLVFACGPHMKNLYEDLPQAMRGAYAENADKLQPLLLKALKNRDVVMIKGSLGSQMGKLVKKLEQNARPAK